MKIEIRYKNFDQFFRLNEEGFKRVQGARKEMKSIQDLGMSGNALAEAEKLGYHYLNLKNLVSDLLFCVGASVLDAKHDIKTQGAVAWRELSGSAAEKKVLVEGEEIVVNANKRYNDLKDLETYLENKREDFETCHYYYKQLAQGSSK